MLGSTFLNSISVEKALEAQVDKINIGEQCAEAGMDPQKGHKDDQRTVKAAMRANAERTGLVQPLEKIQVAGLSSLDCAFPKESFPPWFL